MGRDTVRWGEFCSLALLRAPGTSRKQESKVLFFWDSYSNGKFSEFSLSEICVELPFGRPGPWVNIEESVAYAS